MWLKVIRQGRKWYQKTGEGDRDPSQRALPAYINNLILGDSGPRLCCHLSPLWGAIAGTSTLGGGYLKFYTHNTPSAGTFIHVCRPVPGICLCLQQLLPMVSSKAQGPTCGLQTKIGRASCRERVCEAV